MILSKITPARMSMPLQPYFFGLEDSVMFGVEWNKGGNTERTIRV
jgi:hypothetical protein